MQAIKCEFCGSHDIMKQDGVFVCQNCKTKYSLEEAMKLIGSVKIDKSDDIENLLTLARRFYKENNYPESEKYYELALREAPNNWEIVFFHAYCHALNFISGNYSDSINTISNGTLTALKFIYNDLEEKERPDALHIIVAKDIQFFDLLLTDMKRSKNLSPQDYDSAVLQICKLYRPMETIIKQYALNQLDTLCVLQRAYYNTIKKAPWAFRWGERRELLARLKKELGI